MHPLHDYVAKQLVDKLESRRVVVWYDERSEFQPFVDEARGGPRGVRQPVSVSVGGTTARLAEYVGSMFELRAVVEPHVSGDSPAPLVIYMPGCVRDRHASVLMEVEKAGTTWEPQLKQLARNILLQKYTFGIVDEILRADRNVSYHDVARVLAGGAGAEPPSVLKSIFHETTGNDALLAEWIMGDARDAEIAAKDARDELAKMIRARLGLEPPAEAPLPKLRAIVRRYLLAGEFRLDLLSEPPASLEGVPQPTLEDHKFAVRELARRLRASFADSYPELADEVEDELGLKHADLPHDGFQEIDTFRFQERALLHHAGDLIVAGTFDEALAVIAKHEHGFWLNRDVGRRAQWEAVRRMAELGSVAGQVRTAVNKTSGDASAWLGAYTAKDGWYRLDRAQRRLETWIANLDDEPEERPLGVARRAYEDVCQAMAEGFTKALANGGWTIAGAFHQTRVFSEIVSDRPKPVAYFLVDAMRFEMGVELTERLPATSEISVRAAVAALPSITPIGMAALMPGASASFSVVEQVGKLGGQIEGAFLPDLPSRKRFAAARFPGLIDVVLDELLRLQPSRLTKKLEAAQLVIVRSQEIDHAGETGLLWRLCSATRACRRCASSC